MDKSDECPEMETAWDGCEKENSVLDNNLEIKWKENREVQLNHKNGVTYLTWPALTETGIVLHGFSTRLGGVSQGVCSTMNLSFSRGDDEEAVHENYHRIADAIGFPVGSIVCSDQTHTVNVRRVGKEDCGKGVLCPKDYTDVDGLITNEQGVTLATFYADCVPLYLVDPVHRAIGLSHSGWRGTVGNIGGVTVKRMAQEYGSRPEDIITVIGPSICQDCYEVSEDVAEEFRKAYDKKLWPVLLQEKQDGKYQLNLWEACRQNFLQAGVREENIHMPGICTCCNPEFLFSHRASRGKRGNLAAFLAL